MVLRHFGNGPEPFREWFSDISKMVENHFEMALRHFGNGRGPFREWSQAFRKWSRTIPGMVPNHLSRIHVPLKRVEGISKKGHWAGREAPHFRGQVRGELREVAGAFSAGFGDTAESRFTGALGVDGASRRRPEVARTLRFTGARAGSARPFPMACTRARSRCGGRARDVSSATIR
jgi:hypothetical protein